MVWGSERRGHGVPKEVRPLKGHGRGTRQREGQARISIWAGGERVVAGGSFAGIESISSINRSKISSCGEGWGRRCWG